jgi:hypothetical protein
MKSPPTVLREPFARLQVETGGPVANPPFGPADAVNPTRFGPRGGTAATLLRSRNMLPLSPLMFHFQASPSSALRQGCWQTEPLDPLQPFGRRPPAATAPTRHAPVRCDSACSDGYEPVTAPLSKARPTGPCPSARLKGAPKGAPKGATYGRLPYAP